MLSHDDLSTKLVHAGEERPKPHYALTTPIFQTSTFTFTDTADMVDFMKAQQRGEETTRLEYGRYGNPTLAAVERKLADLDGGEAALLFSSGMAAVTVTLLALLSTGAHVVCTDDGYRRTRQFVTEFLKHYGVEATQVPMGDYDALEAAIRPSTRLIFSESPTNPHLRVADVAHMAEIARRHDLLAIIDSTFATPINLRPLALGADLAIHSATKYLGATTTCWPASPPAPRRQSPGCARCKPSSARPLAEAARGSCGSTLAVRARQNERGVACCEMSELNRYSRQTLLPEVGISGQERLLASTVAVVGCGALGSVIASTLVRAGVGHMRVIDRDYIELNNLQRQVLFDEEDIARGLPKAVAAAEKLQKVNSHVDIEPVVADVNPDNVERLMGDVDLVMDGTDNFEVRFLLNDACVKHEVPWVYGGAISTYGMARAIIPHRVPCFRCMLNELPPPGSTPTCDTVGVLGTVANVVASLEVTEGLKILLGKEEALYGGSLYVDVWTGTFERIDVGKVNGACPVCDQGRYEFLEARQGTYLTSLCGREAVQVNVRGETMVSFPALAKRLEPAGEVRYNDYMLRLQLDSDGGYPYELVVFPDGRAIVKGTADESVARTLYARYIGL